MIRRYLTEYGYKNADILSQKFDKYRSTLKFYNENRCNLTAITDDTEIEVKHFIDSLLGEKFIAQNSSVLDIGSGAGFPGLPIKIVRNDISLTMVDSVNKKVEFLKTVISELSLSSTQAIHSRAEDLSKEVKYDVVVSRAVASLNTLAEYDLPFVKKDGLFIAYKAGDVEDELNGAKSALKTLGGEIDRVEKVNLFSTDITRSIVIIKKVADTPTKYPRSKNLPRLKPL